MKLTITTTIGLSMMLIAAFGIVGPAVSDAGPSITQDAAADVEQDCVDTDDIENSGPPCCIVTPLQKFCVT